MDKSSCTAHAANSLDHGKDLKIGSAYQFRSATFTQSDTSTANFSQPQLKNKESYMSDSRDLSLVSEQGSSSDELDSQFPIEENDGGDLVPPRIQMHDRQKTHHRYPSASFQTHLDYVLESPEKGRFGQVLLQSCQEEFEGGLQAPACLVNAHVKTADSLLRSAQISFSKAEKKKEEYQPGRILGCSVTKQ